GVAGSRRNPVAARAAGNLDSAGAGRASRPARSALAARVAAHRAGPSRRGYVLRHQWLPDHAAAPARRGPPARNLPPAALPAPPLPHPARLSLLPPGHRGPAAPRHVAAHRLGLVRRRHLHRRLLAEAVVGHRTHLVAVGRGAFLSALAVRGLVLAEA